MLKVRGIYSIMMIPIQEGSMELHMHENCAFFLPVYCTSFLAAQHTTVCLVVCMCFKCTVAIKIINVLFLFIFSEIT